MKFLWPMIVAGALCGTMAAQTQPKHLNPVIEKLAAGKPINMLNPQVWEQGRGS